MPDFAEIQSIRSFKSLVRYLRRELDWPVDEDDVEDLAFDYEPEELGLAEDAAVEVREIKQIRPLADGQPWGIFWIDFEPKRLPVVVMRRILRALVRTKRAGRKSRQAVWDRRDLMFISATGEGRERGISFAHFRETGDGNPQLRTFSWNVAETHLYYIENLHLESLRWPADPRDVEGWRERWSAAFTTGHRETIRTSQQLASRMAQLAAVTREAVNEVYLYEKPGGPLHTLYDSFRRVLIHDLSADDFADMYAQTVTYGLFSARATRSGEFALENVVGLIPNTNPFLRDLFAECLRLGAGGRKHQIDLDELGVGELVETLKDADIESVLRDFGRQARGEDPVIHFYESFLREYDADKKARRGVFYTPDPVVSFIVRSVDHLLRAEFDCPDGLADTGTMEWEGRTVPKVQVLDPATGTGTFLKYVIEQIYETFQEKHRRLSVAERRHKWNEYVPKHLLPRLYGFELMMAPYAVAHMKLGLTLKHTEYDFASDERLRVYLTNALQPAHEIPRTESPSLAHEAEEANAVKTETPIRVVVGNPPYSGHSVNNGEWITNLLKGKDTRTGETTGNYFEVDGRPLGEVQVKWLHDDYVKFVRFAQWCIENAGGGILAMITNNGYLDNPTFRGMRQQLVNAFSEIYILNLHGNTKRGEAGFNGTKDENVFDITQGVAICLMVSCVGRSRPARVWYVDLCGSRHSKYETLLINGLQDIEWQGVQPSGPYYQFSLRDEDSQQEYLQGWALRNAMPENTVGVVTARDDLTIKFAEEEVMRTVRDFASLPAEEARMKYGLGNDARDWKVEFAQRDLHAAPISRKRIARIQYRPFDTRFTYYTGQSRGFIGQPQHRIMRNMLAGENIGLSTTRSVEIMRGWEHIFCTADMIQHHTVSLKEVNYLFPLYIYDSGDALQPRLIEDAPGSSSRGRRPNLAPAFIAEVEVRLGLKFTPDGTGDLRKTVGPEDIFHYMYAMFHSPTYRERYAEFLKIDFPRLPLTRDLNLFRALAAKGSELVALHLMESPRLKKPITRFVGKGDGVVAPRFPKYDDETVWINDEQGFEGVPEDVWGFHVGGYQVCHKWLKDRRGRKLSAEDRAHYAGIVVALKETIRLMEEIDEAIPGWPLE